MKTKSLTGLIIGAIVGVFVLITGLQCCSSVGPTERGIAVTMGKPSTEILTPGMHFKAPFVQSIVTYDLTPIAYTKTISADDDNAPVTSDKQSIGVGFEMFWSYDEDRLYEVATKYRTKDSIYEPSSSALKSILKDEIGKITIDKIVTDQAGLQERIRVRFENDKDVQKLPIVIQSFRLANVDWSKEYDARIKKTMETQMEVEQTKQEVAKAEAAAQRQIKEAEAEKQRIELESEAALIKAQKEAQAKIELAKGEAEAKKVKAEAEKYEAQQIAQAQQMKQAQWAHEEKMKSMEVEEIKWKNWDGDLNPKYVPITAAGTIVDLNGGKK